MSLQTWKDEFFPTKPTKRMTKRQAIEHSLRKWEGLKPENLMKHGVSSEWEYGWIKDDGADQDAFEDVFEIDASSCSLCVKYLGIEIEDTIARCSRCPLSQHLGNPCDYTPDSPYMVWRNDGDPLPMIKALKQTLEENK